MRPSTPASPASAAAFQSHPGPRTPRLSVTSARPQQLSFSALHGHDAASTGVQWSPATASPSALGSPSRKLRKVLSKTEIRISGEKAMGRRWIRWMQKRGIEDWVLPGAVMTSVLIKWCIGLGSYSGEYRILLRYRLTREYGRNGNAAYVWGL